MALPPPPPGFSHNIPEPDAGHAMPPPPVEVVEETHENDVLKRRAKFSWKKFGGDGFMVSVAIHVILAILGIFWFVTKYADAPKKPDADVFATGAGGGANGDKAKAFEHKMKTRNTQVKLPSRIVSKSANASVSLPSTPSSSTAAFATGLASGGMSKGSGGGSGGGEGTGIGIGKGGGRNFVSVFGSKGLNAAGLPVTFYDTKQMANGDASPYAPDTANEAYIDKVLRPFVKNWDTAPLQKFFVAPTSLVAGQILIAQCNDTDGPKAFEVEDKAKGRRWVAHYKGLVTAPKTGKFRFVVLGDDALAVRFNGKTVADGGWTVLGLPGHLGNYASKADAKKGPGPGITADSYKGQWAPPFRCGTWIEVTKGQDYPMEILLSEIPGGKFSAYVFMEEADTVKTSKPDGKLFLFRMNADELPETVKNDSGLAVDMDGKGLVWKAKGARKTVR